MIDYGAGMLGEHAFPTALLTSKYVLVCDPMPDTGLSRKYNEAFLCGGYLKERFVLEESVDMGNGYTFHIYRRTAPVDAKEVLVYRDMLTEESQQYPYLYRDVIDQFLLEQGLTGESAEGAPS